MSTHAIGCDRRSHQQFRRCVPLAALETFLSDAEIETLCRQLGHPFRRRRLPPGLTVRSLVYRGLHPDKSIAAVLADLAAENADLHPDAPTDSAWCQARSRLPLRLWEELIARSYARLALTAGDQQLYHGRPVYVADGTTLSMPDTPALVDAFDYYPTAEGTSRFPLARLTLLLRHGAEAILDWRLDSYHVDENTHLHAMWHRIPEGSICLFDRHFSSYYNHAKLHGRRIDTLSRLHQRRDPQRLIRAGKRIGANQWIVRFHLSGQQRKKYRDPSLPQQLTLRLIRVRFRHGRQRRQIWLITTLLDPQEYPASELIALYRSRWGIETRIGDLKTTLQLYLLRSKTPANVRCEVAATLLAHNLLWTLIHQAARQTGTPPQRISFAGAVKTVVAFCPVLGQTTGPRRKHLYRLMLRHIAAHTNRHRPGRTEPRAVRRDPRRYPLLKLPRKKARQICLS